MELQIKKSKIHRVCGILVCSWAVIVISSFDAHWTIRALLLIVTLALLISELRAWRAIPSVVLLRPNSLFLVADTDSIKDAVTVDVKLARAHACWVKLPLRRENKRFLQRSVILYRDSFTKSQWCALKRTLALQIDR